MSWYSRLFNPETGSIRGVVYPGYVVEEFTSSQTQTDFDLTVNIDAESVVDMEIDGRLQRSGSHYTVDYDNNKIVTESGLNEGSWVRVKIYNK